MISSSFAIGVFCQESGNNETSEGKLQGEFPRIIFDEFVYDFGEVEEGQEVTHVYKFKNEGQAILKIDNVRTTCGCTAALITKDEIAPGKEGEIKVTFKTKRRKGDQSKRITVRSNDPDQPVVTLTIKGKVKVEVEVKPNTIFFGQINKNMGLNREITIIPSTQKDFKVESIETSSNLITTVLENYQEADKRGYKVKVKLAKEFKPGRVNESVMIKTNNPKVPQVRVAVSGTILGDIAVSPGHLSFMSSSVGVRNVRRINLVNSGDIPLKVQDVQIASPGFTHELKTVTEGKQIEITVIFKPDDETSSRISTRLLIKTNIPDQREIQIPIYTSLRQAGPVEAKSGALDEKGP